MILPKKINITVELKIIKRVDKSEDDNFRSKLVEYNKIESGNGEWVKEKTSLSKSR